MRRLTACLLALLMLAAIPAAHAVEVSDLAILSQWDERFYSNEYRYNNNYFRFGGCGPSSIANGLIASLGVTDQDLAAGILLDVMNLLTNSTPATRAIQAAAINVLDFDGAIPEDFSARYPSLSAALNDFGGKCVPVSGFMDAAKLKELLPWYIGRPTMYLSSLERTHLWENLCAMSEILMNMGLDEAAIVVHYTGAGTASTNGPFRSGTAGHYLSLCIRVKDFCENGVFYVLDSFPRALEGEAYGPDTPFGVAYDFVGRQSRASLASFNELFEVTRIQPTILQVQPRGEALAAANFAARVGAYVINSLLPYLKQNVVFFGTPRVFVVLPEYKVF